MMFGETQKVVNRTFPKMVIDVIKSEAATVTSKALSCLVTCHLSNFYKKNSTDHISMNLGNCTVVLVPMMKTCSGRKALSFRGAKIWNKFPSNVKPPHSRDIF